MAFVAHTYNDINGPQIKHGNELINVLLDNNPEKFYQNIVDVGSGSGNLTKQLSERLPHNKIIALDIDSGMTRFAQNNYPSKTIDHITEDISKPWNELSTKLKEVEGKVSLIFANRVLHWVENKETAVKNMSRLLNTGGDICINISAIQDLTPHLSREFNENFLKLPSIDEQFEIWRKLLIENDIQLSVANKFYPEAYYDRNTLSKVLLPIVPKLYQIYVKSKDPEVREKVINDPTFLKVAYDSAFCFKKQFKPNSYQEFMDSNAEGFCLPYGQFRYIGRKN